jgi:hypothetical protein
MKTNFTFILFILLFLSACSDSNKKLNADFGEPEVRERIFTYDHNLALEFTDKVQPIIENRCVVCHGCYDAPCQLKLSSAEGIDRGFSPENVYATRFSEIEPTRILIDAKNTQEWRNKEKPFKPVLNERANTPVANLEGSVFYKMLTQKLAHPTPDAKHLPDSFDLSLTRSQTCPSIESYDHYSKKFPLGGMPYGLPAIDNGEFKILESWLRQGAIMAKAKPLPESILHRIDYWENMLNQEGNKSQLIARYIYEHLFLGHIYFSEEKVSASELPVYFRLVRSATPPGQAIDEIATRRPYEDPKVTKVYYRLRQDTGTVLTKTHMPYAFNSERDKRWQALFYDNEFKVTQASGYQKINNAFKVFEEIPPDARYKFMLDNAEFFIMGFIKGPSCRGPTALNLIQDKFWVFFMKPNIISAQIYDDFLLQQADNLELPSDFSVEHFATTSWLKYSKREKTYIAAKIDALSKMDALKHLITLDNLYVGNENSALSIFRNLDSGVVKKGLHGEIPKTAWVIDYPVFERIHYLLVAGFDIYSPVRHQLITRLYMDFLRIESEMAFMAFLPKGKRKAEMKSWYKNSTKDLEDFLSDSNVYFEPENSVTYHTQNEKIELLSTLKSRQYNSLPQSKQHELQLNVKESPLSTLNKLPNLATQQLSQTSFIRVFDEEKLTEKSFTLLRHNARTNVSTLLLETRTRQPELDSAEIFKGFVGSYPQTLFNIPSSKVAEFVNQFMLVTDKASYEALLSNFAVRRTSPDFWTVSDQIHKLHKKDNLIDYGLFDYNRLENR